MHPGLGVDPRHDLEIARIAREQQNVLRLTTEGPSNIDSKAWDQLKQARVLPWNFDLRSLVKNFPPQRLVFYLVSYVFFSPGKQSRLVHYYDSAAE